MCTLGPSLADLCRRFADLEYDLQCQVRATQPAAIEDMLHRLQARGDTRAASILEHYAGLSDQAAGKMPKILAGLVAE